MDGRGGAGKVIDLIDLYVEGKANIVAHELKVWKGEEMLNVVTRTGVAVIDAENFMTPLQ